MARSRPFFLCALVDYSGPYILFLQTILKYAIDDVIHHELVCRRLKPDADPKDMDGLPALERETGSEAVTAEVSRGEKKERVYGRRHFRRG